MMALQEWELDIIRGYSHEAPPESAYWSEDEWAGWAAGYSQRGSDVNSLNTNLPSSGDIKRAYTTQSGAPAQDRLLGYLEAISGPLADIVTGVWGSKPPAPLAPAPVIVQQSVLPTWAPWAAAGGLALWFLTKK